MFITLPTKRLKKSKDASKPRDSTKFKKVVVALDKDATDKSLTMMRALNTIVPTGMLILDKDLKTLGDEERGRIINTAIA